MSQPNDSQRNNSKHKFSPDPLTFVLGGLVAILISLTVEQLRENPFSLSTLIDIAIGILREIGIVVMAVFGIEYLLHRLHTEDLVSKVQSHVEEISGKIESGVKAAFDRKYKGVRNIYDRFDISNDENLHGEIVRALERVKAKEEISIVTTYDLLPDGDNFDIPNVIGALEAGANFRILWADSEQASQRQREGKLLHDPKSNLRNYIVRLFKEYNHNTKILNNRREDRSLVEIRLYGCSLPFHAFVARNIAFIGYLPIGMDGRNAPFLEIRDLQTSRMGLFITDQFGEIWRNTKSYIELDKDKLQLPPELNADPDKLSFEDIMIYMRKSR